MKIHSKPVAKFKFLYFIYFIRSFPEVNDGHAWTHGYVSLKSWLRIVRILWRRYIFTLSLSSNSVRKKYQFTIVSIICYTIWTMQQLSLMVPHSEHVCLDLVSNIKILETWSRSARCPQTLLFLPQSFGPMYNVSYRLASLLQLGTWSVFQIFLSVLSGITFVPSYYETTCVTHWYRFNP